MEQQQNTPNPGKGMGVTGFIISLVALVVGFVIYMICAASAVFGGGMGLAIFWTVLSVAGLVLSFMGMNKSKAAGHKPGLAMGGLIVGIFAVCLSLWTIYTVHVVKGASNGMQDALNSLQQMGNDAQHTIDSMNAANGAPADTSKH